MNKVLTAIGSKLSAISSSYNSLIISFSHWFHYTIAYRKLHDFWNCNINVILMLNDSERLLEHIQFHHCYWCRTAVWQDWSTAAVHYFDNWLVDANLSWYCRTWQIYRNVCVLDSTNRLFCLVFRAWQPCCRTHIHRDDLWVFMRSAIIPRWRYWIVLFYAFCKFLSRANTFFIPDADILQMMYAGYSVL